MIVGAAAKEGIREIFLGIGCQNQDGAIANSRIMANEALIVNQYLFLLLLNPIRDFILTGFLYQECQLFEFKQDIIGKVPGSLVDLVNQHHALLFVCIEGWLYPRQ